MKKIRISFKWASTSVFGRLHDNDKNYWSKVNFDGAGASLLQFPTEIAQVGYRVVPNFRIGKYDGNNQKIVYGYDNK